MPNTTRSQPPKLLGEVRKVLRLHQISLSGGSCHSLKAWREGKERLPCPQGNSFFFCPSTSEEPILPASQRHSLRGAPVPGSLTTMYRWLCDAILSHVKYIRLHSQSFGTAPAVCQAADSCGWCPSHPSGCGWQHASDKLTLESSRAQGEYLTLAIARRRTQCWDAPVVRRHRGPEATPAV